jgi:hypothetical protein
MHYYEGSENNALLQEINPTTGKQIASYLNVLQHNKSKSKFLLSQNAGLFRGGVASNPKFVQYLMDTIMILDNDGIKPFLTIESEHLLTPQYLQPLGVQVITDLYTHLKKFNNDGIIWHIHNYVECKDLLIFNYLQGNTFISVFYRPAKNWLQICYHMDDDLVYKKDFRRIVGSSFSGADENGIYKIIQGNVLGGYLDVIAHNGLNDNLDRLDELKQLTEDSNPVLFYYEYEE